MITYSQFSEINHLASHNGLNPSQIAEKMALNVVTVKKWLKQKHYQARKCPPKPSKLDPFKDEIIKMLESYNYTAVQVETKLREQGYDGGYTIIKDYVRKIRPKRSPAFLTLSFLPGECAQVDWGEYGTISVGSTRRRLSFFVMVLCFSRMLYLEFTVSKTMEHFLACHENAFRFFGGVPSGVMVDNLKSAVLKRIVGQEPVLNPKYAEFAEHWGFTIKPCNVGKGNEKGRVENGVGYVKKNFLGGLNMPEFKALQPAANHWRDTIANVRIHGVMKQKPLDVFPKEYPCLQPLPFLPYDISTIEQVRVSRQFRVTLDTNRYSVPAQYAGQLLTLKIYPNRICLYDDDKLVARHTRSFDRHRDFEDPDHPKELLAQRKKAKDQKIIARFLALSSKSQDYYGKLEERRINAFVHVRKIVALSEIHGAEAVAAALEDAFQFHAYSSEYIANILEQRSRVIHKPGALLLTRREDLLELEIQEPDLSVYR